MLIGMGLLLALVGIAFQLWVLCAFAILAVMASRMFTQRRTVSEPERSARLRAITFGGAGDAAFSALTFVTKLWLVGADRAGDAGAGAFRGLSLCASSRR